MKRISPFIIIGLFLLAFATDAFAQSSYKGVSITRGDKDPRNCIEGDWRTNCVYVCNYNKYPATVRFEYKLNSRDAPWQQSGTYELKPYQEGQLKNRTDKPRNMKDYNKLECYNGEIKALRIVYVNIDNSEKVKEVLAKIGIVTLGAASIMQGDN